VSHRRFLCAWVAVALLLAAAAPSARADGDPASDVLLGEAVFYPYSPAVSAPVIKALNAATAAAARAHFPLKVALIGSPVDLGVIPALFGHPQKYADFLDQEISFQTRQPLLVVMSDGYGVQGVPPAAAAAAAALAKPASGRSDDLARAATVAVERLARAAGHPIGSGSGTGAKGSSGRSAVLFGIVIAAAVLAAGTVITLRRRAAGSSRAASRRRRTRGTAR
jgi:hypothetical protein